MKQNIPPLRASKTTFADRAAYLNYLFRVNRPGLIDPQHSLTVYVGLILRGIDVYTHEPTWRIVMPWRGCPFGPIGAFA